MGEIGKVTAVTADKGMATILLKRGSACEGCRKCMMGADDAEMIMEAENLCGAVPGDRVEVELRDGRLIMASLIMYGGPLLGLVAGAFLGYYLFDGAEGPAFAAGVLLMCAVYAGIRVYDKTLRKRSGAFTPMAVAVRNEEEA